MGGCSSPLTCQKAKRLGRDRAQRASVGVRRAAAETTTEEVIMAATMLSALSGQRGKDLAKIGD